MPDTTKRSLTIWLLLFAFSVAALVIWGGYTRLTRSGLSIVEWHPISGAIPPLGSQAWQDEFAKYQETPEFKQVNFGMTLEEYRFIFYIEWIHRMLARLAGLLYALPLFYFLFAKRIRGRDSGIYIGMGLLFVLQAFAGWFMVASGLEDRPSVSHYLLTFHLMLALTLFGLSLWTAMDLGYTDRRPRSAFSPVSRLAVAALVVLLIQIAYGGLTAGLKAGHISDTWPLMFGQLVPPGFLTTLQPWYANLLERPPAVAFVHRWLAFAVLGLAASAYLVARRSAPSRSPERSEAADEGPGGAGATARAAAWLAAAVVLQILLGISVVVLHVRIELALLHQALAIGLLALNLRLLHRSRAADR